MNIFDRIILYGAFFLSAIAASVAADVKWSTFSNYSTSGGAVTAVGLQDGANVKFSWTDIIAPDSIGITLTAGNDVATGGTVNFNAGVSSAGDGGHVLATAGDGATSGGHFGLFGGFATNAGIGGKIDLEGGKGGPTSGNGGAFNGKGGDARGIGAGGASNLIAGNSTDTGNGGDISVRSGDGGMTTGNAGNIQIQGGNANGGDSNGGNVLINAGFASGMGIAGVIAFSGDIQISGDTTGSGTTTSLGTNSPAITLTSPYTWLKFLSGDGSIVWIPAYK